MIFWGKKANKKKDSLRADQLKQIGLHRRKIKGQCQDLV